jgi:lysophospholipase L1-like esterase
MRPIPGHPQAAHVPCRLVRRRLACIGLFSAVLALVLISLTGCGPTGTADRGTVTSDRPAGQLSIVALGDSVTAGTACGCKTFVQLYAGMVRDRTGADVTWTNDGVNGQTSGGMVSDLRSRTTAAVVQKAAVVIVTIGANDLGPTLDSWQHGSCSTSCMAADLPEMSANVSQIVTRVHQLQQRPSAPIAVTDYWNVFEDGQVADRDFGKGFAS